MKTVTRLLVISATLSVLLSADAAVSLPRSSPEAQGVRSGALQELVTTLDNKAGGMHSLMVVRHGQVIAEGWWAPYAAEQPHVLYSLSKSFTSTAVGFCVAEGKLNVDDLVLPVFPEDSPATPSDNLKAMRLRDLLTMATGHQDEPPTLPKEMSAKSFLAQPVPHLPGTHFKYNTPATFMQSAMVQKVTGQTVLSYLQPRLFDPLGIDAPVWDTNFQGISLGGYGLRLRTEDIAKFGQFYLQKGNWNGRQLLPVDWIEMASSKQVSNGSNPKSDWNQGYGFQFWRCRNHAYRGDGAFGQFCVVMPEQDAVVAITSGLSNMQAVLDILWEKLLPAFEPGALALDDVAQAQLTEALARLQVPPAAGGRESSIAARMLNRTFVFPSNDQGLGRLKVTMQDNGKNLMLALQSNNREITLPAGYRQWQIGRAPFSAGRLADFPDEPVTGSYAWAADDVLEFKVCGVQTPFVLTYRLKVGEDEVTLSREANVSFGPTTQPAIIGRLEARTDR